MLSNAAVIVWQLRGLIEDVHCFFESQSPGYLLSIERAGELLLEERHDDFQAMLGRASELRSCLVRIGFEPVSAQTPAEPMDSLLLSFVRIGTAPLAAVGQRPS